MPDVGQNDAPAGPRRGDHEDGSQGTLEERAGLHERDEDREHDIEDPDCGGSTGRVRVQDQRVETVKYPTGSGDPIGRKTIRVIACASGSILESVIR